MDAREVISDVLDAIGKQGASTAVLYDTDLCGYAHDVFKEMYERKDVVVAVFTSKGDVFCVHFPHLTLNATPITVVSVATGHKRKRKESLHAMTREDMYVVTHAPSILLVFDPSKKDQPFLDVCLGEKSVLGESVPSRVDHLVNRWLDLVSEDLLRKRRRGRDLFVVSRVIALLVSLD